MPKNSKNRHTTSKLSPRAKNGSPPDNLSDRELQKFANYLGFEGDNDNITMVLALLRRLRVAIDSNPLTAIDAIDALTLKLYSLSMASEKSAWHFSKRASNQVDVVYGRLYLDGQSREVSHAAN